MARVQRGEAGIIMTGRVATSCLALAAEATATAAEQWVHLLPAGTVQGRDGRGPYIVRDLPAVIHETRRYAGRNLIVIDYEHQADHAARNGKPAPAAGWVKALQQRADGIWGLVEWTERAAAHLRAKEYRYLSPVFTHTREGRVLRLLRAGLTNNPNLELTALASTEDTMLDLAELRQLLGLPEDADDTAITDAIRELVAARQSAAPDLTQFVPIGEFERVTAEMNRLNQGVSRHSAEIAVSREIAAGRLAPMLREWGVALCTSNKPAFDAFVERTASSLAPLFAAVVPGRPPGTGAARGAVTAEQLAVCDALGHKPDELITSNGNR